MITALAVITVIVVLLAVIVPKARARGKRKFADGPYQRAGELKQDTSGEHIHDAD